MDVLRHMTDTTNCICFDLGMLDPTKSCQVHIFEGTKVIPFGFVHRGGEPFAKRHICGVIFNYTALEYFGSTFVI